MEAKGGRGRKKPRLPFSFYHFNNMAAEKKGTKTIDPKQLQQSVIIPLPQLVPNKGQISGVPANPRTINVIKYKKLKERIEEDPEML
ncbi:MAG: hypothetical protein IJX55_08785, partial [Clostridia bacterium]|nr:hypothetical protein [Clostridia bacterium]